MMKNILILVLFQSFSKASFSQSSIGIIPIYTTNLKLNDLAEPGVFNYGYGIRILDNTLFIFGIRTNKIIKYDLQTKSKVEIELKVENKKHSIEAYNLFITKDEILCFNREKSIVTFHKWDGSYIKQLKFKLYNTGLELGYLNTNFEYDTSSRSFYLPIEKKHSYPNHPKIRKTKKYYTREGLVGKFNSEGKLIDKIGSYDKIYWDSEYNFANKYWFNLDLNSNLIISQQLSPNICIYVNREHSKYLNLVGSNITKTIDEIPQSKKVPNASEYYSALIQSYSYYNTDQISENLYCRKYVDAALDTTKSNITLINPNENKSKVCNKPSEKQINQVKILSEKKEYLIISDSSGNILYDGESLYDGVVASQNLNLKSKLFWSTKLNPSEIFLYLNEIKLSVNN